MRRRRLAVTAVAACLALATGPAAGSAGSAGAAGQPRAQLDVATYNLYLGADLNPLFGATSLPDLVERAGQVFAAAEATRFPERAEAIADLLAREKPDLIGLQEVALWETAPGTAQAPGAFTTRQDFLAVLLAELAARGTAYTPVATTTNFTGTLPIALGGDPRLGYPDSSWARFTDRDVTLVRTGVPVTQLRVDPTSVVERTFAAQLTIPSAVPGVPAFEVPRGWSSVDVTVKRTTVRFVNTHLEAFVAPVRTAQARELAAVVQASPHPVVLVGDINSRPPGCGAESAATQVLLDAGLRDAWSLSHPGDPCGGPTIGQAADLRNDQSLLDARIDVVMVEDDALTAARSEVIGEEQRDRTEPTGLWPSDHAGSVARVRTDRP